MPIWLIAAPGRRAAFNWRQYLSYAINSFIDRIRTVCPSTVLDEIPTFLMKPLGSLQNWDILFLNNKVLLLEIYAFREMPTISQMRRCRCGASRATP